MLEIPTDEDTTSIQGTTRVGNPTTARLTSKASIRGTSPQTPGKNKTHKGNRFYFILQFAKFHSETPFDQKVEIMKGGICKVP
jgi:hypothetical protein